LTSQRKPAESSPSKKCTNPCSVLVNGQSTVNNGNQELELL